MTKEEYYREHDWLARARISAETEAYRMENLYRDALRKVDTVKEQTRQLEQAWTNQQQESEQQHD